jgi:glycine cleavage system H lipoate-binding protein
MFPGVSGFHWSAGHIIFLTAFGLVLATIVSAVWAALWRTVGHIRSRRADAIRWHLDFSDLPERERACRHALSGSAPGRVCPQAFDCRTCERHATFAALEAASGAEAGIPGTLDYPARRYYHRGHTWVEPLRDGTLTIGLDDLGSRIAGKVERVELPAAGREIAANSVAWTIQSAGRKVRVRAPIDGIVVDTGGPEKGWYLKVRPRETPADLRHLLAGAEVGAWLRGELDRLQTQLAPAVTGANLPDGGVLLPDLPAAMPNAAWDLIAAAMFLEP